MITEITFAPLDSLKQTNNHGINVFSYKHNNIAQALIPYLRSNNIVHSPMIMVIIIIGQFIIEANLPLQVYLAIS